MKYNEVETGKLLKHPDESIYIMVIEKRNDSFDYIKYRHSKTNLLTNLHKNIESKYWNMTYHTWTIYEYVENRRILHSIIKMLFKKGLQYD